MRIGIDARFLTHPQKGGFKTYSENLIAALAKIDTDNHYFLYLDRDPGKILQVFNQSNFSYRVIPADQHFYGMPLREQYALPRQILMDRIHVFHAPCLTAPLIIDVPLVVTIHDMIWFYPRRYLPDNIHFSKRILMNLYYRLIAVKIAQKAKAIITVSHASKENIIQLLKIPDNRLFVTYEAAKSIYQPTGQTKLNSSIVYKYGIQSNYILGIGSDDPRKNIKTLIRAFALLSKRLRQKYQLVIVWNHNLLASESYFEVQKYNIMERVLFLENVSDEDLVALYNCASIFVFPSLDEGFGLPLLEAMACGVPVLAANNSSIPEIVGNAAIKFDAESAEKLANSITRVLNDSNLQRRMKDRGIERAAQFSWKKCALETLRVYKRVIDI